MAKLFLFGVLLFFVITINAQQEGRMETDRPDQTESPFITKHGYVQLEVGGSLAKENGFSTVVFPTVLWKYGLCKQFEIRLVSEVNIVKSPLTISPDNETSTGLVPIDIGGKLSLFEEKGLLPQTALLFHLTIPKLASKKFQASKWAPSFVLAMQNTLSQTVGLGYNLGAAWDGETHTPFFIYTFSPGINIGKRWYSFIEFFGAVRRNESAQNNIDGGFGYYVSDNIKIDASAGVGITKAAIDHFLGAGISFRFH